MHFKINDLWRQRNSGIAILSLVAILMHLVLQYGVSVNATTAAVPLWLALIFGGIPLVIELTGKTIQGKFGSDILAGISIVTSVLLKEYLAGTIVVLMLSGGEALESYALRNASSVLRALAKRIPSVAHRKNGGGITDIPLEQIAVGDLLVVYPHEICPIDGIVVDGRGVMDESYLTGEPFEIQKISGSAVISGAINGDTALTIRAVRLAADSRYAKIMEVMRESESNRPQLRRLGDSLGAWFTPAALIMAVLAWLISGDAIRFLAVLVIATPCPLLIAIPVTIIGSISLCARRSIIVKSPVVLEQISQCRTAIFDKTGTLTTGEPKLTDVLLSPDFQRKEVLTFVTALEHYSKHPLAHAVLAAAKEEDIPVLDVSNVSEPPGQGLTGTIGTHHVQITSRRKVVEQRLVDEGMLPSQAEGLECAVVVDNHFAAVLRFRDTPRQESKSFVRHLGPKHFFKRMMIISGDRESEVRFLADQVGITEIFAQKSPEEKLAIVRKETVAAKTLYVGDGINDAPAMMAATVGIAIGKNSDITAESAGVVILDNSLTRIDEFMHISRRMRSIAIQSAVGGMLVSLLGMGIAAAGYLSPVNGAICQEIIDALAVLNALRAAFPPGVIQDHA